MTYNAIGNILASATITASGASTSGVDLSTKFLGRFQISTVFGTVAATSGVQVDVFNRAGAGPTDDNIAVTTFVIPSTVSTTKVQSFTLPTGKWDIKLTNLDGTNSVTACTITSSTLDAIA
jgi:hypothetical protein